MALKLLTERVGQPREPAHRHPHDQVVSLGVDGRYVRRIGISRWRPFSLTIPNLGLAAALRFSYMLIDDVIEAAKAVGALVPASPVVPWVGRPRTFLLCRPLWQSLECARRSTDEKTIKRWAQLEADIGYFVGGGYVTEELLKQLKPEKYGHWELVSRRPRPSLRVFGRFAKPDVFIGTHVVPRARLGGMWSPQFEQEKLVCEDHWRDVGLPDPFRGTRYEDYITENASRQLRLPK